MSATQFINTELAAAVSRGVRQCVVIGSGPPLCELLTSATDQQLQLFAVDEEQRSDAPATFVLTEFASEALAKALERSDFDKLKATLFVWLGGAGYRTLEAAVSALAFIASLPQGSGVLLDYAVERTCLETMTQTALDALASRISLAGGSVKYLIQPQAVATMLRALGFRHIVDLPHEERPLATGHLVAASV